MESSANGAAAWRRTLWVLTLANGTACAVLLMVVPFLPQYLQAMGVEDPEHLKVWAGVIEGAPFLSGCLVSPIWGRLVDRLGSRPMLIRASVGMTLAMFFMAWASSPWELLFWRLLEGAVAGLFPASMAMVMTSSPPERTQRSISLLQAGGTIGLSAGPLLGSGLIHLFQSAGTLARYRYTFMAAAVIALVVSLLLIVAVRGGKPVPKTTDPAVRQESFWQQARRLLCHWPLRRFWVLSLLSPVIMYGHFPFLALFVGDLTASYEEATTWVGYIFCATALASGLTLPLLGRLGDRWGPVRLLALSLFGTAGFLVSYAVAPHALTLLVLGPFLGIFTGGIALYINAALARVASSTQEVGSIYGWKMAFVAFAEGVGPIFLGGVASTISGSPGNRLVFLVAGILAFITMPLLWSIRSLDGRKPGGQGEGEVRKEEASG